MASFVWIHSDLNCRALWGPQPTLLHPVPRQPLGETLDPKQCSLRTLWTPDHTMPVSARGRDRRSACGDLLLVLNCPENKRLPKGKAKKSLIFGFRIKGRNEWTSCTTSSSPRAQLQMPHKSWPSPVKVALGLCRHHSWNPAASFHLLPWLLLTFGLESNSRPPSVQMWCFEPIPASGASESSSSVLLTQHPVLAPRLPASSEPWNSPFISHPSSTSRPEAETGLLYLQFPLKIVGRKLTKCYKLLCYNHIGIFSFWKKKSIHLINALHSVFNYHGVNVPTLQAFDTDTCISWFLSFYRWDCSLLWLSLIDSSHLCLCYTWSL